MAMASLAAARRVVSLGRVSSPTTSFQAASLVPRRGLAGAADHHGPPKVNCWSQPTNPAQWKEEHVSFLNRSPLGFSFRISCIVLLEFVSW
ncbi:unnamed protein product [Linum tenue]|uniref:Uncharacterized protein n=1 Tax=Linum tenue TaxID=586396 RepID=A0AAV0NQE1_9ROSI|nr:unnamed protein product [Linum tenue]